MRKVLITFLAIISAFTVANAQKNPKIQDYIDFLRSLPEEQRQYDLGLQVPLLGIKPNEEEVEIVYPQMTLPKPRFAVPCGEPGGQPVCHERKRGNYHTEKYCASGNKGELQVDLWFLTTARVDEEKIDCPVPPPGNCGQHC